MKFKMSRKRPFEIDYDEKTGKIIISRGPVLRITSVMDKNIENRYVVSSKARKLIFHFLVESRKHETYSACDRIRYSERLKRKLNI